MNEILKVNYDTETKALYMDKVLDGETIFIVED